jgi:hypothetical protein
MKYIFKIDGNYFHKDIYNSTFFGDRFSALPFTLFQCEDVWQFNDNVINKIYDVFGQSDSQTFILIG